MGQIVAHRTRLAGAQALRLPTAYGGALLLPLMGTWTTFHFASLHAIPFSLDFVAVAAVAALGGIRPALLAALTSIACFNYYSQRTIAEWSLNGDELLRDGVLLVAAVVIGLLSRQRTAATTALREAEASFHTILAGIGDGVISTDVEGRITFMNQAAVQMTGWAADEAKTQQLTTIFQIKDESTGAYVESPLDKVRRLQGVVGMPNNAVLTRRDGTVVHIDDSGAPIRDRNGDMIGMVLVFRDVGEKRSAEKEQVNLLKRAWTAENELRHALEDLEERTAALKQAQQHGKAAAWYMTVNDRRTSWYEGGFEIFGRPFSDLTHANSPTYLIEEADRPFVQEAARRTIEDGDPFNVEFRVRWPDGELHWLEARGGASPEDANIWRGVTFDITERKRSEDRLRESERFLHRIALANPALIYLFDVGTQRSVYYGQQLAAMLGYKDGSLAALEDTPIETLAHPDDVARISQHLQELQTLPDSQATSNEYRMRAADGSWHWFVTQDTVFERDAQGKARRILGCALDVTERKSAELALIRSEKLAAIGRLASTIAHEINNPLEAITNLLYLATADGSISEEGRAYLTRAGTELARVANISRLTLSFVRNKASVRKAKVLESAEDVLALFNIKIEGKHGSVIRDYAGEMSAMIAVDELHQILSNLISNAADAMSGAGCRLRISARKEGKKAKIKIEDSGIGIPSENFERIFDPFFTTKEDVGTGIGLWLTRELVVKNGGHISVESGSLADGMRTRFTLDLPLAEE